MARKIYEGPVYDWKDYHAFIHLFETLAKQNASRTCIYYKKGSAYKTLTWEQVDRVSTNLACRWSPFLANLEGPVGVLADHSIDYLFYMIALLKLRVVLLALSPRNSTDAVTDMLSKGRARYMMASDKYADSGKESADQLHIPFQTLATFDLEAMAEEPTHPDADRILDKRYTPEDEEKIVIITHSSGTTAFPKLIPLSNRYMFVHVQHFTNDMAQRYGDAKWTLEPSDIFMVGFPLFHIGGIFQAFCAMMHHGASVYTPLPLQVKDVVNAIDQCGVTYVYFAPVLVDQIATYIRESGNIAPFKRLKVIQFGGAPLRPDVGEFLTSHGIRLQCCYGASEFAISFLNDDARDDIPWNSTRPSHVIKDYCDFEPYDEQAGTYHLVIKAGAPTLATGVSNRPNGDYGTSDLFIQDPPNSGYWRHLGRKDDILVMENAEKTNPTPMEFVICNAAIVKSCTVIGEGQQCTAALVELEYERAIQYTPAEIIQQVHVAVANANETAPSYSTIFPEMVYILPLNKHLPTTVKGNVIRKRAIMEFGDVIEMMYSSFMQGSSAALDTNTDTWSMQQIESFVAHAASTVLKKTPGIIESDKDRSLFDAGLNSLLAIQLRNMIAAKFGSIPNTFLYDHPSIHAISAALRSPRAIDPAEHQYQETQDLLESYLLRARTDFSRCQEDFQAQDGRHVVLLTGATGSLGSFILRDLVLSTKVHKVYCLVRGTSDCLMDRLRDSFRSRHLDVSLLDSGKVEALPMDLNAAYLGWTKETYDKLKQEVTIVQACGWLLDFNQPIARFDKECIRGLYNLLKFAHRPVHPMQVHTISTVSATAAMQTDRVPERAAPQDPHVAMPMGYAQSKYIVEQLFDFLAREKRFPCFVVRMGQVCGDTEHGVWSTNEQYPLMMVGGGAMLKQMPDLGDSTSVDWLPVNYAAASITEIMLKVAAAAQVQTSDQLAGHVFHVVNPKRTSWQEVLTMMRGCGMEFDTVTPEEWIVALSRQQTNPAYRLLTFYEKTFTGSKPKQSKTPVWETIHTVKVTDTLSKATAFDSKLMAKCLQHWKNTGFHP